ncbi:M23 family metallopeptidase [Mycoplasma sp. P36-A1]|uniref:M23 family metallopeptidase n=1 Tax=Mycoplasma sp. P36-A1 TaxID=3252900 RepID=UPI003C2FC2C9
MKKYLYAFVLIFVITISQNNIEASRKCTNNKKIRTCTTTASNTTRVETYTYKENSRKNITNYVSRTTNRKTRKLTRLITKTYHSNGRLKNHRDRRYTGNRNDITKTYYSNGKRRRVTNRVTFSTYTRTTVHNYLNAGSNGRFSGSNETERYRSNNRIRKTIITTAHSNGRRKQVTRNDYNRNGTRTLNRIRKFRNNKQEYYYRNIKYGTTREVTSKTFNAGRHTRMVTNFIRNNKTVKSDTTLYHSNGGNRKSVDTKTFNNNARMTQRSITYYNNARNGRRTSLQRHYFNGSFKRTSRKIWYYNASNRNTGLRTTTYNVTNGRITNDVRNNYFNNSTRISSRITNAYNASNTLTNSKTDYFNTSSTRYQHNEKRYNNSARLTSNINYYYTSNRIYLKKGYEYNTSNYTYLHDEYNNGTLILQDKTVYRNNTTTKTSYERSFYKSGKLDNKVVYTFNNSGNITSSRTTNSNNVSASSMSHSSRFPITNGVITSSNWFYPSSFGGGWHPGIDIASYRHSSQGFAQYIRWTFDNEGVVLSRNNSCNTTNSSGCGAGGFGNSVLIAVQHQGKFYTILYGHNSKLATTGTSTNANIFRSIAVGNKVKNNQIIGRVGSSGFSTGYHIHLQIQEHTYAKSISDIQTRFNRHNKNILFNVNYNALSNYSDIVTVNPDIIFNLRYYQSWSGR